MPTDLYMYAGTALLGLAVALGIWGGRAWLARRYEQDKVWVRESWLRFNPEPPDAMMVTLFMYGAFTLILIALLAILPYAFFAFGLWLVLLWLPRLLVEALWQARRRKIDEQIPVAIATMCNSMRAGLTLVQSLERMAENSPEPIKMEFRIMASRYAYGADLESTIREAKKRLELANFNLFASALLLNREMGGDVAATLNRISQSLDKLHQMRKTVEAHTAEGRTNIKVLLVAPVLMLLLIASVDAPAVKLMFTTPQGYAILLTAGLLVGVGVYMASRIMRSEV